MCREASINYVGKILLIFDPLPLRRQVYKISLRSSIGIWLTPLPLACLRSLWMPPDSKFDPDLLCVKIEHDLNQCIGAEVINSGYLANIVEGFGGKTGI